MFACAHVHNQPIYYKMKRIFFTLVVCLVSTMIWAVPAKRVTFSHTQKDGTVLTLMLVGDEHLHYYINQDTNEPMQLGEDGDYKVIAPMVLKGLQEKADVRRAAVNAERVKRLPGIKATQQGGPNKAIGEYNNMFGEKKGLVILVNFKDVQMVTSNPQEAFYNQFNQPGYNLNGHIGSVADYFHDQSYGQFSLNFDVVGPVTVSKDMAYYGAPSPDGDNDTYPATMVIEALQLVDPLVNFADYDWNGDGEVDQVFVVYAGYNEAQGADENTIWPHEWNLYSASYWGDGEGYQFMDGVYIDTYACSSELAGYYGTTLDGIGTACHEFSHCLGYPDMYDTDYANNGQGNNMGYYDVMAAGSYNGPASGTVPCGYTAYERWMAGWIEPTVLTDPATIKNMPALNDEGAAYVIYNSSNNNEYLMLENRQCNRWFGYTSGLEAGHGILITHCDYDATAWSYNQVNAYSTHQRFTYVPADKSYGGSYIDYYWSDFFPGTDNVTTFTGSTHKSYGGKWFNRENGSTTIPHEITEITENNGLISFLFDGGVEEVSVTIGATGYATLYYSDLDLVVPEGVTAKTYIVNENFELEESRTFAEGNVIPAGYGVVLTGEPGTYQFAEAKMPLVKRIPTMLSGSDEEAMTEGGALYYKLSLDKNNTPGTVGFYWGAPNGGAFMNGAHKAYLVIPGESMAKNVSAFPFYGKTVVDGVKGIKDNDDDDGVLYNLGGQRVDSSFKGIVIKNGKKMIIK